MKRLSYTNVIKKSGYFCVQNIIIVSIQNIMYQAGEPGIENTVGFRTNDAWPEVDLAKLYDQLLGGSHWVGDTTMHQQYVTNQSLDRKRMKSLTFA